MADIYGSHFEYASKSSREYGLIIANIETNRLTQTCGEITGVTIFNKVSKRNYLIDDDFSDFPLSFDIEIIQENQTPISYSDRRKIAKWLFNKHSYRKLYIDMADDFSNESYEVVDWEVKRNYLNCRFINPEKIENDSGVIGYKATIECDSGMFWQDATIKEFSLDNDGSESSSIVTVNVDSDIDDYIYPIVTITLGNSGGNITIANNSDNDSRLTQFVNMSPLSTIIMKGEINYISGNYYEKFQNRNFIRLLDGDNNISILGDVATIKFEFQNRRVF